MAAGTFVLVAALGWVPFVSAAWRAPYIERAFVFVSLALGMMSLALIYDAVEHFLGNGRGIYFVAIFCSLPTTGILISNPGLLPVAMLLLLICAATWFAVRAKGDYRAFLLAMLAGILLISGFGFQWYPGALVFAFAVWLSCQRSSRPVTLAIVLVASYGFGILLRQIGGLALPTLVLPPSPEQWTTAVALMPWRIYVLPLLIFLLIPPRQVEHWQIAAVIVLFATAIAGFLGHTNLTTISIVLTPVLVTLAGGLVLESFTPDLSKPRKWPLALPPLIAAVTILAFGVAGMTGFAGVKAPVFGQLVFGALIAVLLVFATLRWLPRVLFALLFATGLWFGSFLWPAAEEFQMDTAPVSSRLWWVAGVGVALVGGVLFRTYYGRRIPRKTLTDGRFRYAGEELRTFHDTSAWEGKLVSVARDLNRSFSFMVFGDVTGAESPIAGQHGGYFAFRSLTERMKQASPAFAISLGDLATSASALPFRRVRQLLRMVPVPLTAIPGNHDVFRGEAYYLRYFQSLFGADEHSFRAGPVQLVLVNNAMGAYVEEQFAWLEETLRASDAPFLLVFCHKPIFDLRPGGCYAMERRDYAEQMHQMFRTHEVTAVLSGHIHTLLSENRDGVNYIISGGGGSKLSTAEDVHHYLNIEVTESVLTIRALPVEVVSLATPLLELHFSPRSCSFAADATSLSRSES